MNTPSRSHTRAVAAVMALAGCGHGPAQPSTTVCEIQGGAAPIWGDFPGAKSLPSGRCEGDEVCTLTTKDTCPDGQSPGPAIDWQCNCTGGEWRCIQLRTSKSVCIQD